MELQATRVEARVVGLRWSMYRAPDFKQYSIVRTVRAADGPGAENAVVFTTNDRGLLTFNDRLPAGVEHAGYRVIALDRAGRVVGASPIIHI